MSTKPVKFPSPVDVPAAQDGDVYYRSVTSIIGVLDKPALLYWAAEETARKALASYDSIPARIAEEGHEQVLKWLTNARFASAPGYRTATELGSLVHKACEKYALTGQRPEVDAEVAPFLDRFEEWAQQMQPEYVAAEMTVYNPEYGYAGTLDAVMRVQGLTLLVDYKTSRTDRDGRGNPRSPYTEACLQLAGLRYATLVAPHRPRVVEDQKRRSYLLSDAERERALAMKPVDAGAVLLITPERASLYPVACNEQVFHYFTCALELARWRYEESPRAIGAPIDASRVEVPEVSSEEWESVSMKRSHVYSTPEP